MLEGMVLELWDGICLPHMERKLVSGFVNPILGFEVDTNWIMVYLSPEKHQ